jgi:hypothetical protein
MGAELHQFVRGRYFLLTKPDRTLAPPDPGYPPNTITYAGYVRDHASEYRFFFVDIFGSAQELSDEDTKLCQRIISVEELMKASWFPDFESMQVAVGRLGTIESINLE